VLQPYPAARMRARVVSKRVNKPEHDDASVIEPA
jgi:putative SOS response-associated peptidase YedK